MALPVHALNFGPGLAHQQTPPVFLFLHDEIQISNQTIGFALINGVEQLWQEAALLPRLRSPLVGRAGFRLGIALALLFGNEPLVHFACLFKGHRLGCFGTGLERGAPASELKVDDVSAIGAVQLNLIDLVRAGVAIVQKDAFLRFEDHALRITLLQSPLVWLVVYRQTQREWLKSKCG